MIPIILLLARMCVAEAGFTENLVECELMWHVMDNKPGELRTNIVSYNTWFKSAKAQAARPYIANLHDAGRWGRPVGLPSDWSWKHLGPKWVAILEAAEEFYLTQPPHPCPAANHYGGRLNGKHADDKPPHCWVRVWCGRPKSFFEQAYWRSRSCKGRTLQARVASGR